VRVRALRQLPGAILNKAAERMSMPSKHFCPASNTPDPEFPVVATSSASPHMISGTVWAASVAANTSSRSGADGKAAGRLTGQSRQSSMPAGFASGSSAHLTSMTTPRPFLSSRVMSGQPDVR
jgi:hypothetical protein